MQSLAMEDGFLWRFKTVSSLRRYHLLGVFLGGKFTNKRKKKNIIKREVGMKAASHLTTSQISLNPRNSYK